MLKQSFKFFAEKQGKFLNKKVPNTEYSFDSI